ncbi:MAG: response regulator [Myxococcota bacterium]|jgi:CheY-like chemotaxis protein|nr:response regulator [Myxococcota bacterium]
MAQKSGTALGVARARFVDGLPRKGQELKGAIALLVATPNAARPREELRRRLHALYASAQVFRLDALATALKEGIQSLDAAKDGGLSQDDLDALTLLSTTLPALGRQGEEERGSVYPSGPRASAPGDEAYESAYPIPRPPSAPAPRASAGLPPAPRSPSSPGLVVPRPASVPAASVTSSSAASTASPRPTSTSSAKLPAARTASSPGFPSPAATSRADGATGGVMTASTSGLGRLPARPEAPLDTVVSVLVIDAVETQAAVREALPGERYELFGAGDAEAGLRLARTVAPDVVLVDVRALASVPDLVVRLHADAATELVPVGVLLDESTPVDEEELRQRGVDAILHKPATPGAIRRLVDRLAVRERSGPSSEGLGEATVEEVADRIAREIRRGLVEAAASGRDQRIELGDGSELLAAAWATIARVRTELADRSHGKVRFRDGARRGGPAFMALAGDEEEDRGGDEVSLEGRRVIVADDDPAVVWFFAGLLREAGAHAVECEDGREALDEARRRRPDVIVSDILMPRLDGLALCRELKRDPGLADVPVILLSWKEDFLQRMRELQSGASGYLRKEAGSGQILSKVREVLRPRARLEARLRAGGEVRGRIEVVGVRALLRATADLRSDARVTLRDAWSLFEVDVRGGQVVDVTRTATDGSFARGERTLPALLGVSSGRFTVDDAEGSARPSLRGDSEALLTEAAERLGAHVDAVSGANLSRVALVRFDELLLQAFLRTSIGETRQLVERVAGGESPRALWVDGRVSPVALETALVDLARRGAVTSVRDEDGEDLVASALEARKTHAAKPSLPPRPREAVEPSSAEPETSDGIPAVALVDASAQESEVDEVSELLHAPTNPPPEPPPPPRRSFVPEAPSPNEPAEPAPAPLELRAREKDAEATREASPEQGRDARARESKPEPAKGEPKSELAKDAGTPSAKSAAETKSASTVSSARASAPTPRPPEPEERSGLGVGGWIVLVLLFGVAGYFGWRTLRGDATRGDSGETSTQPDSAGSMPSTDPSEAATNEPSEPPAPPVSPTSTDPAEPPPVEPGSAEASELSFGRTVPTLVDPQVAVAEGQGLLVIEASEQAVQIALRRRDEERVRELGAPPVTLALDEGQYELVFRSEAGESVRFLFVRAGQTRIVRPER